MTNPTQTTECLRFEVAERQRLDVVARIVAREACDNNPCFGQVWTECGCVIAAREIVEAIL